MKQTPLKQSVLESTEQIKKTLQDKGFTIFCDIDHQANARSVDLDMPASRVLIFGNPQAGTKLMQKDITMSLDLPLRLSVIDNNGQTMLIHQTTDDYCKNYQIDGHPVMGKIETLFSVILAELN